MAPAGYASREPVRVDPWQTERQDLLRGLGEVVGKKAHFEPAGLAVPDQVLGSIVTIPRLADAARIDQVFESPAQRGLAFGQAGMSNGAAIESNQFQIMGMAYEADLLID